MTARRFTDKPDLDPGAVWSLPAGHPAMVENRTLFPSTVVEVTEDEPERLLVSGRNNRKLGQTVAKGAFKGYALYGLSLEERATCPEDCHVRATCYGSGMQTARRHRIGDADVFFDRLGLEICELLDEHDGLLIRLHVLGDFPSVEYVSFWAEALDEHPKLSLYGYTARKTTAVGGDEIGDAIESVKERFPDRFRIRWSSDKPRVDGATIINYIPKKPRIEEGLVCPAQTEATACCASCGLCWSSAAEADTIVFIKHGPKSFEVAAAAAMAPNPSRVSVAAARPIEMIPLPSKTKPAVLSSEAPTMRMVSPFDLLVEPSYQRDLSGRSITLIRKIVAGWDWAKFKPPVCAETNEGLFVIDGQHTAIAAASHPAITSIPAMVVSADMVEKRADAFVAHNRDRLAMSAFQVFHAEVSAKAGEALGIMEAVTKAGAFVPRAPTPKDSAKPGQVVAMADVRAIYRGLGAEMLTRILRIAVRSKVTPISTTITRGLRFIFTETRFAATAALSEDRLSTAIASIVDIEQAATRFGGESGQNRYRACAVLIAQAAGAEIKAAA